jgi:class 3 adenylate cyclase
MRRRLAAILSLDVVGFSAEMARNDERTLSEMKRVFRSIVRPAIREHGGRVVKFLGDGALAEFPAASAALAWAVRIQTEMAGDPVRLRAGIHVGEITEESGDVFGDTVNVASRLQTAAPEGGVLVSRMAADMAGSLAAR